MRLLLALVLSAALAVGVYSAVTRSGPSAPKETSSWPVADPADENVDPRLLARAARRVDASVLALLVARHGRLVLERYYHGYDRTSPFDLYSITKSVTSALVGIALSERRLRSVGEPLADFLPVAGRAHKITLRHLLTMTAGFPGDADPRNSVGEPADLVRALLRRPLVHRPGAKFAYDTPSSHLLSAVITRATGGSEGRYAQARLFGPLGIHLPEYWPTDDQGTTYGGTGLTLTARDAAKLGQLYLDRGRWHGRQLVPAPWVAESTRAQVELGLGRGYGYDWWTERRRGLDSYAALGYGGQMVAVILDLDLVVAVFSDPGGEQPDLGRILFDLVAPVVTRRR